MNRLRNSIAVFAFALLILGLPSIASAQWGNNRGNRDDDYYGNGNRNNRNLQGTIRNLKNSSSHFERRLDRELDNSRYDGGRREDRILQTAHDFRDAVERLDRSYDNRRDYNNSYDEARRVLDLGSQLERMVSRLGSSSHLDSDWNKIKRDLNVLANDYNYNGSRRSNRNGDYNDDDDYNRNDRNNRNNRSNRRSNNNNDWRRNIPFPLPF